ncbi:5-formyltetrahydrofolate cyclo-ligase [Erwinia tracheiphila]|uniref:5-formyltetrahydrofolate cyclo-ligase n=1 Tax=Erwinia tracheiphila TaxID=65700 RepID=A0A0M2K7V8_9GAMM|nr:5-formyltetrahydrofolate cyclo-ligase [Erwinia tracheiphila]AXF76816.1 5-formyltetrahydrofolate cyclo-ligase [Erwinia tracheiphila]EOS95938.1 5-formyltetrahydrofolate cyclo-ligase [Erwinia tracheiphila PSU-1]KKF35455.1 5-formyltetrahydrofolate cyclo-ligase [Erwinia tracheiphila]UIA84505.1 5-formyltetrahydrofolate cyclo-ligase [Erwinia tracheiphila]UIA87120.1 5-formyltetrahydrofolate cyclo-ligase [Erwinia tracheiphila]
MPPVLSDRQDIRRYIRQQRQALTSTQQQQAAQRATQQALGFASVFEAKRIALFLSFDGELDTTPLISQLWQQRKEVYLPVLHPFAKGQLLFLRYQSFTPLTMNRLRIPEPPLDIRYMVTLSELDVLIVPLVAFDAQGQRLGMGGGFYDRTLQNWRQHGFLPVGLAHDCQQVASLPIASWDIPLPAIITPSKVWLW